LFGTAVLTNNLLSLVPEISERLREKKYLLATAESCTGGMIAAAVTDLAGSSDIFAGAIIAYSNRIKETLLGVPAEILRNKGAVSAECAGAMVNGVCERLGAQAGIAVTGIAGPGGGTPQKPVGLVYIAAKLNDRIEVRECNFRGNRAAVRNRTRATAFLLLRKLLIEENT